MKVFETQSPQGTLRQEFYSGIDEVQVASMLEQFVIKEEWYQISFHHCYNDEGKPCEQWQVLKTKGEIPTETLSN